MDLYEKMLLMSFAEGAVKHTAGFAAGRVIKSLGNENSKAAKALMKLSEKIQNKEIKRFNKFKTDMLKKYSDSTHMWMSEKDVKDENDDEYRFKQYMLFDDEGNTLYNTQAIATDKMQNILLYNKHGVVVAGLKVKRFAFRIPSPLSSGKPVDYSLMVNGDDYGKVVTTNNSFRNLLAIKQLGWVVKLKKPFHFIIESKQKEVMAEIITMPFSLFSASFVTCSSSNIDLITILAIAVRSCDVASQRKNT